MNVKQFVIHAMLLFCMVQAAQAQPAGDSLLRMATLQNCVQYAIDNQPFIRQAAIDEDIVNSEIKSRLADWYPQIGFTGNYQHYFQLPSLALGTDSTGKKQIIQSGVRNTSTLGLSLSQNIFNRDVLLASRTAGDVRLQARQLTTNTKINITVAVSKAFYDILATQQQITLLEDDIARLTRSLQDAYNQYKAGIVDKIDYKRATIALNNSKAQKRDYEEQLTAKYARLKYLMGYPQDGSLTLQYDTLQLERDAALDTLQAVRYEDRIEYRILQTQQNLAKANLTYNKLSFLPTVSAFGNYNLAFFNQNLNNLYSRAFPNSYAGLSVNIPIFQGFKRVYQVRTARLQLQRIDWDFVSLKDSISSEYAQALANYKANYYNYSVLKENVATATEVYNTIQLQYKAGIKTYLDVILAENDLRTAQVNYTNALYDVLISKLDVQQALGNITYP
jgi:outer membrane protein TolC